MRRRMATLILAATAVSLFPTMSASGGNTPVPTATLDIAREQGFNEFQLERIADHAWNISGLTQSYGYADDPFGTPTVTEEDARGTMAQFIGMEYVRYTDPSLLPASFDEPTFVGEDLFVPFGTGGIRADVEYAWFWAEFDDDIPIDDPEIGLNFAFPFYMDGYQRYANSAYPGDSWQAASHVAYVYSDSSPTGTVEWSAGIFADDEYLPEESLSGGLAWFCGRTLGILVPTDAFRRAPEERVVEYGFAGDMTLRAEYRFDPNAARRVEAYPAFGVDGRDMLGLVYDPDRLTLNIGYEALVDFIGARVFYDEAGQLWANIRSYLPWPTVAAIDRLFDFFSIGVQWGLGVDGEVTHFYGLEGHDNRFSLFGSTPDGEAMPEGAQVMKDGSLNVSLGLDWSGIEAGSMLKLYLGSAFWRDEDTTERQSVGFEFAIPYSQIVREDPDGDGVDSYPTFDFLTQESVAPPPTATTDSGTQGTDGTEGSTSGTDDGSTPPGLLDEDGGNGFTCWLYWGLVLLFAAYLIALVFIRLDDEEWWTCWIVWFILIFGWAPFLLVGLTFYEPGWWQAPLLLWFPLIGGYTWGWARRQDWWEPPMLYVSGGYLAVLAIVLLVADSPEWGVLLPVFWLPLVAYYLWRRGIHRPWWRQEMYGVFGLFVAFVFVWAAALSPEWAWWLPVALAGATGWWFTSHDMEWSTLLQPKWTWIIGFTLVPFLAWWIPEWGAWWGGGIALVVALIAAQSYRGLYLGREA